ncbi:hypothetical protein JMJ77_0015421 [Colletotrichum scovillei]|uniref:Uncharacterized protein n=1 Tax=Colletotrichum scovillei TaxID=1209932 RepID=A0A9P7R244_9PEZI|nr:hypothetical protein JMJ77_0015421 [Colletotrichum scovillei]KAG7057060.1 hypothetical protein JMJ78_0000844 [Colletotrichum scovillei]KAG7066976.1 hypothetical protein JMJ76_0000821 [Colletotrichum scovillei]
MGNSSRGSIPYLPHSGLNVLTGMRKAMEGKVISRLSVVTRLPQLPQIPKSHHSIGRALPYRRDNPHQLPQTREPWS